MTLRHARKLGTWIVLFSIGIVFWVALAAAVSR